MKTNKYLIEYATAQIGLPYWFGTFGQKATKKLYEEKKKQYPKYYTAKDFPSQYGLRVHDCAGLIKGALWSETPTSAPKYDAKTDYGATAFYNNAKIKGKIDTFDKVNGRLVFKGNDKSKSHVGVYVDGYVIEAKGHAYGVVKTKFNAKSWQYWAQCNLLKDDTSTSEKPAPTPAPAKPDDKPASKPKDPVAVPYVVIAKRGLNLRKGNGLQYPKITVMPKGSQFLVVKIIGEWAFGKGYTDKGECIGTGYANINWLKKA